MERRKWKGCMYSFEKWEDMSGLEKRREGNASAC